MNVMSSRLHLALENDARPSLIDDRGSYGSHNSLCELSVGSREASRLRERVQWGAYCIENILQTLLSDCRALNVLDRTEFTRKTLSLLGGDHFLLLSLEFFHYLWVIT